VYVEEKDSGGNKDIFRGISKGVEAVFFFPKLHTVNSFLAHCLLAAWLPTFSSIRRSMDNQGTWRDARQTHNTRHYFQ